MILPSLYVLLNILVHWKATETLAKCDSWPSIQDNSFSHKRVVQLLLFIFTVLFWVDNSKENNLYHGNIFSVHRIPCSCIPISTLLHKMRALLVPGFILKFLINLKALKFYITFKHTVYFINMIHSHPPADSWEGSSKGHLYFHQLSHLFSWKRENTL